MVQRVRGSWSAVAALVAGAALLYAPALGFEFLAFDDPDYVTENVHVSRGLGAEGLAWAFGAAHAGNWHPLTWLSHMLDVTAFGLAPAGHHATNVALHALNAALVFLVLRVLTGRSGRSFVVAAVFAVHPVQVESVAWVAERKNLLSTSFGLLALGAYAGWVRHGGALRWAALAAAFLASLLSKAMLVTLPFALLLLDVWPLARHRTTRVWRLVLEKLPLLALSAAVSAIAYRVQSSAGAVPAEFVLPLRLAYAPIAYVRHLAHLFWPAQLGVLYPHPLLAENAELALGNAAAAAVALALLTALAALVARRGQPAALVGWLFFLGTLVPVIGVVQVGNQALADRYAYVPLIGLLVALVWSVADALAATLSEPRRRLVAALLAAAVCAPLALATHAQLEPWRSSHALFLHTLAVTGPNPVMLRELGVLRAQVGDAAGALPYYEQAVALAPRWGLALQNLGGALSELGHPEQALPYLEQGVALDPGRASGHAALGSTLLRLGRPEDARAPLSRAVEMEPTATFLALLAEAEARSGQREAAIASLRRAVAAARASGGADVARLEARLHALAREGGSAGSGAAEPPKLVVPPAPGAALRRP
jgi:tetratricopeptide (TPR) repeat protein